MKKNPDVRKSQINIERSIELRYTTTLIQNKKATQYGGFFLNLEGVNKNLLLEDFS
jgi:hypothetical protein